MDHEPERAPRPPITSAPGRSSSTTWDHNSQIVLKPNPNWAGTKPILTELDMSIDDRDCPGARRPLEAGEIDMVTTPAEDIQRVKADPTLGPMAVDTPGLSIDFYDYNNGIDPKTLTTLARCAEPKNCPTMNKDFRIALTQAVDKQALIDADGAAVGNPANSFIMPGIAGYQPDLDPYPFDLEPGEQHMTTALGRSA